VGHDLLSNRPRPSGEAERSAGSGAGVWRGVPLGARGPPYLSAGLRISPDFLRMSLALKGEGTIDEVVRGPSIGMIPVKSSLRPFSRFRGGIWGWLVVDEEAMEWMLLADSVRTGRRRGMKLSGPDVVAGVIVDVEE
jgi:hypothetical protein